MTPTAGKPEEEHRLDARALSRPENPGEGTASLEVENVAILPAYSPGGSSSKTVCFRYARCNGFRRVVARDRYVSGPGTGAQYANPGFAGIADAGKHRAMTPGISPGPDGTASAGKIR